MGNDSNVDMERLFLCNSSTDMFKVRQQEDCRCNDNEQGHKGCDLFRNGHKDIHRNGNN